MNGTGGAAPPVTFTPKNYRLIIYVCNVFLVKNTHFKADCYYLLHAGFIPLARYMHGGSILSKKEKNSSSRRTEVITAYLMMMPDILGLLVFVFIPILYAFYVSLHDWNGISPMVFSGSKNYLKLLKDDSFWKSIKVTVKYTLIYVPTIFCLALLLASLLHSLKDKVQSFFRTAYFMPYAISSVIAGLMWSFNYDPMKGYFNQILKTVGLSAQKFLASTTQSLASVASVGIWMVLGYNTILFLSAIKDIPVSYYEAADIDGAGSMRKFFTITLPLLKNTSLFILVVTTIGSFQAFDIIKVMTNGGPAGSTTTTVLYIYQQAFEVSQMGYSSAVAFILFLFIMLLTLLQMKLMGTNKS